MLYSPKTKPNKKAMLLCGLVLFFLSLSPILAFASTSLYVETGILSPNSGQIASNQTTIFNSTFLDSLNWKDIEYVRFMVNTSTSGSRNCAYAIYIPLLNRFCILDDSGRRYLGGFAPGSNNKIENSYFILDCSKSSVVATGNTLTVNWAISFKSTFTGNKNLYLYIRGIISGFDGWDKKGAITISDTSDSIPPTGTIQINSGSDYSNSTAVTLNLSAQDDPQGSGVSEMQFSNDNSSWPAAEPFSENKQWSLSAGDGIKTVYVKFKDAAGNWSQVYSDTIILDTTAPELNIISPVDNEVITPE